MGEHIRWTSDKGLTCKIYILHFSISSCPTDASAYWNMESPHVETAHPKVINNHHIAKLDWYFSGLKLLDSRLCRPLFETFINVLFP